MVRGVSQLLDRSHYCTLCACLHLKATTRSHRVVVIAMRSFAHEISESCAQPWPICVINLAHASSRMKDVSSCLSSLGLPYKRFEAVNGEALSASLVDALTVSDNRKYFKRCLTRGEIGCFASHLLVWYQIANSEHERVIVLEDDARLFTGAGLNIAILADRNSDWDILKLCYEPSGNESDCLPTISEPRHIPFGTTGYAITRAAARHLLSRVVPFSRPVDIELKTWWEHGLRVKVAVPPIGKAVKNNKKTSAIENERQRAAGQAPLKRFWRNLKYQAQRRADKWQAQLGARPRSPITNHNIQLWPVNPVIARLLEEIA